MGIIKNRLNEENYNNFGSKMRIIKYKNIKDVDIYFPEYDWIAKGKNYNSFKKRSNKMPL